jgi:hypothetical protein
MSDLQKSAEEAIKTGKIEEWITDAETRLAGLKRLMDAMIAEKIPVDEVQPVMLQAEKMIEVIRRARELRTP